jgi:hypothetical protein
VHAPLSALTTPVTAYQDLTKSDLKFIRRHARRIARSLESQYEALGDGRWIDKEVIVPEGKVMPGQTPHMLVRFMRNQKDEEGEATLTVDLTVIKPRYRAELAIFGLDRDPNVKERQLVLHPTITRDTVRDEIVLDELRMRTAPSMGSVLFSKIRATGLIECSGQPYLPLNLYFDVDGYIENNFAYDVDDSGDIETRSKIEKARGRRHWDSQEKYLNKKMIKLQDVFKREAGHIFKRVNFTVNWNTGTFCLAFYAQTVFNGRYMELKGDFALDWDEEHDLPKDLKFKITKGSVSKQFNGATGRLIDILDCETVLEQIFDILEEECNFKPHAGLARTEMWDHRSEQIRKSRKRPAVQGGERRQRRMGAHRIVSAGMP